MDRIYTSGTLHHACRYFVGALLLICSAALYAILLSGCGQTCTNGSAQNDILSLSMNFCSACNDGYVLENGTCRQAVYTCNNGTAASGNPATGNIDVENCTACADGYVYENDSTCRITVYTCANGEPTSGNPNIDNTQQCAPTSCNAGFVFNGATGLCEGDSYTCENGTPIDGTPTTRNEAACAACLAGYVLDDSACRLPIYTCAGGTPREGTHSGTDDIEHCSSCHFGYALNGTVCEEYDGTGTEDDPYIIRDYADLDAIRNDLGAHYALLADINARASWSAGTDGCAEYDGANDETSTCEGWAPVGVSFDQFSGSINGRGHTISNLYSKREDTSGIGFIGFLATDGEVRNIRLSAILMRGKSSVGGLVGENSGTVRASHVSGIIHATAAISGGMVGYNGGGTIVDSSAAGAVTSDGDRSGGLVGFSSGGSITNCYATAAVSASRVAGGLIGQVNRMSIVSSYATGSVRGIEGGGFVGQLNGASSNLNRIYATGQTTGASNTGGLVGRISSSASGPQNSYWDTEKTTQLSTAGTGTGLTTAEMQADSSSDSYPDGLGADDFLFTDEQYPRLCAYDDNDSPCTEANLLTGIAGAQ